MLMAIIFALILSFYLRAQVANQKNVFSQKDFLYAQLMFRMTREQIGDEESGQLHFNKGISDYQKAKASLKIVIRLENAATYHFEVPIVVK
jgi:hypothetical protein